MRALLKTRSGPGNLAVGNMAEPIAARGEIVVRVSGCGVCGTDLTIHDTDGFEATYPSEHPRAIGHEFAGEVIAVGESVTDVENGQWVVVNPHNFDRECEACRRGYEELCTNRTIHGHNAPGGMAEQVAVRAENAYVIDAAAGREVGPLGEPLSVALHAVERLGITSTDNVAVVGPGPIGILVCIACQEVGVSNLLLVGLAADASRLELASRLGVETAMVDRDDLSGGVDVAFEAAGATVALDTAIDLIRPGGRVGVLGIPHSGWRIDDAFDFVLGEKSLVGSRGFNPRTWQTTVRVLTTRRAELASLITHRIPLEAWEHGFAAIRSGEALKVVVDPALSADGGGSRTVPG